MKKFGFLLLLVSLGAFTFGCAPADQPADDAGYGADEETTDDTGAVQGTDDMSDEEAELEAESPDSGFDISEPDTAPAPEEGAGLDEPAFPAEDAVEEAPEDN